MFPILTHKRSHSFRACNSNKGSIKRPLVLSAKKKSETSPVSIIYILPSTDLYRATIILCVCNSSSSFCGESGV